jgi:5'-nucleotidase
MQRPSVVLRAVLLASVIAAIPACGATSTPIGTASASTAAAPQCLSIVAWNDMHGQLGPDEVQVDATRVPAGGVIAVADQIAAIRATGDTVVVLDAGDLFTGPLDSTVAEGAPVIDAYNVMGVDAAAIGNHEFDFGPVGYARVTAPPNVGDEAGPDGPRGALFARMNSARFPFLSANLHRADGRPLAWPHLHPSTRIARGRFDLGVVGYTTIETPTTTLKPNISGLTFAGNAAASVAAEVRQLRAAGATPIVLLAHASLDGELPQLLDDPADADTQGARRTGELATLLDGMPPADRPDLIVAGHRHQWMVGRVRGVPIVSSDQHGVGLSRIRYCRAGDGSAAAQPPRIDRIERRVAMASSKPSSELGIAVAAAVAPWQAKVKSEAETVIATLRHPCPSRALNGTALTEQLARAIAESANAAAAAPSGVPVVAIMNSGGVRAPLRAGPVRYGDVFTTSPFENGVAICATTRAGLARTLANSIRAQEARERLPFGIAGAKVALRRATDGALTLESIAVDGDAARGTSARDDDPIWMAVPDFILWGGDALLEGVTCTSTATSQLRVRDAWRAVLAREQACDGPPKNVVVRGP